MDMNRKAYRKASLTLEAALILPVFATALLVLLSVLLIYNTEQRMHMLLVNTAESLAVSCSDGHNEAPAAVKDEYAKSLRKEDLRFIESGAEGIDMSGSVLDDPEYIELSLKCELVPLTDYFGILKIPYRSRCLTHIWCGYDAPFFADEEYVYVTNDSEVYHIDRQCSHILLGIRQTSADAIGALRNENGNRYRACGICHAKLSDEKLYITTDGDRYHNSITCSGLKRTVYAIKKSEIGDLRPCSRCGR